MMDGTTPALFGLNTKNSNKDLSEEAAWGKNQFPNTFPVALACYMYDKGIEPVYIELNDDMSTSQKKISFKDVFGLEPLSDGLFFEFESYYTPYNRMVSDTLSRIDLVTQDRSSFPHKCIRPIEIKLTALPDNTTVNLPEEQYGSEIVVRPDTIVYLALSIATVYKDDKEELGSYLAHIFEREDIDWTNKNEVGSHIRDIKNSIDNILNERLENQTPYLMQPIWKTDGKKLHLKNNCLDIIMWSDYAFTRLFMDTTLSSTTINRRMRTIFWLARMLYNYSINGLINFREIIDTFTYDTKNDKAFAVSGTITNSYTVCEETIRPRITKDEIKNIILGGGDRLLSPERRLDVVISTDPSLF